MRSFLRRNAWRSGAGLCDLGLQWAGFRHQWFCEIDPFCRAILARHWPDIPLYEDVKTLKGSELPPVDVLCGGFPCQDVSSGGLRAGIRQGTRSGLWLEYARLIGEIRPKYVIIEASAVATQEATDEDSNRLQLQPVNATAVAIRKARKLANG